MLTLSNGTKVKIVAEGILTVTCQGLDCVGYDGKGNEMFNRYTLSKKRHKGELLLDGVVII